MDKIQVFAHSIEILRQFFREQHVSEVLTPPAVANPGIEPHLHPFQLYSAQQKELKELYLHTSPEFWMKWLLANSKELNSAYTLSYCFRDEPRSEWHREQFLMLEWYRKQAEINVIMDDCENLLTHFQKSELKDLCQIDFGNRVQMTVKESFDQYLGVDLSELLDTKNIKTYIEKDHKDLAGISEITEWEDAFFLLFLNKIEPHFKNYSSLILKDFPIQLAALSKANPSDPKYCLRFEWYLNGIEIANCFQELTDLQIQKKRAQKDLMKKDRLYQYQLPEPKILYDALETGLPECSGIALGFERFLKIILKNYDFQFI